MDRTPWIESLESRRLLHGFHGFGGGGFDDSTTVLKVNGTDANDTINVALASDGKTLQATSADGTVLASADVSTVRYVYVTAGAGADTVNVDANVTKRVVILGGDGNDTINVAS